MLKASQKLKKKYNIIKCLENILSENGRKIKVLDGKREKKPHQFMILKVCESFKGKSLNEVKNKYM